MNRRTIALIILIIGLGMLTVVLVLFLRQQDQPVTEQPAATDAADTAAADGTPGPPVSAEEEAAELAPGTLIEVVVSLQTVPRGFRYPDSVEELEAQDLVHVELRDATTVKGNFITSLDDVVGKYARTDLFQGETLTGDSLVADLTQIADTAYGPSSLIPQGTIAVGIPMDRLSGIAYAVTPGDYIDILISFPFYKIDEQFQTYLENDAAFYVEEFVEAVEDLASGEEVTAAEGEGTSFPTIFTISPFGRFEELPTGDLAHIGPSELQRPILVSVLVQNARVIQVGAYAPPEPATVPTPLPDVAEGEPTPTSPPSEPTMTPTPPPNVLVVALSPQQQLFLKYAHEVGADIDFAMRGINDGQLYTVEQVDLNYLIERFDIDVPPNIGFSVDQFPVEPPPFSITPTPEPATSETDGTTQQQDTTGETE